MGWTRQLRVTPLKTGTYFRAKVMSGYLMALLSILAMSLAGSLLGVRLSVAQWATMVALVLVGLVPFAVLGILFGHLLKVDSLGPALGGSTSLLALHAAKSALGPSGWPPAEAWIVIAAWTAVLAWIAQRVYQRDTARV